MSDAWHRICYAEFLFTNTLLYFANLKTNWITPEIREICGYLQTTGNQQVNKKAPGISIFLCHDYIRMAQRLGSNGRAMQAHSHNDEAPNTLP